MDNRTAFILILIISSVSYWFGVFTGVKGGKEVGIEEMQKTAIQKGYAIYHPDSGDFTWKVTDKND